MASIPPRPARSRACAVRRVASGVALLAAFAWAGAAAQGEPSPGSPSRGRLLYETHCIACHNSQMHWRDRRIVEDWDGLVREVDRWQSRAHLGWSRAEVLEVARHLNEIVYRLPRAPRPLARVDLLRR